MTFMPESSVTAVGATRSSEKSPNVASSRTTPACACDCRSVAPRTAPRARRGVQGMRDFMREIILDASEEVARLA